MSIFITGDTHGAESFGPYDPDGFIRRLNQKNFGRRHHVTKNDYVVICGDFGGIWETNPVETASERNALNWLNDKPFTTLIVPGNHENYDRLTGIHDPDLLNTWVFFHLTEEEKTAMIQGYPQETWNGGLIRRIRPSVFLLEPGVFQIDGHTCAVFGGAASHDIQDGIIDPADYPDRHTYQQAMRSTFRYKQVRTRGISWWPQEEYTRQQQKAWTNTLQEHQWTVDFVFTHEAPASIRPVPGEPSQTAQFLDTIRSGSDNHPALRYKHWFFGHYHNDKDMTDKDHALYADIIRQD